MKGFLNDGPAAGQAFEVSDPPIRRGIIVLGESGFGESAHRYYLSEIDDCGAVYTHGGAVRWPPEAGPTVTRRRHAQTVGTHPAAGSDEPSS
jgi:hypothetical protein